MSYSTLISAHALRGLTGTASITLLDSRFDLTNPKAGHEAYLAGHIPGAVYVDLNRDLSAPMGATSGRHPLPSRNDFAATLRRLGVNPGAQVIVYDASNGSCAARAWWMLRWMGHAKVAVLDGGLQAWLAAHGPVESGETQLVPGRFVATPSLVDSVSTERLQSLLGDPNFRFVDARAPERFAGTVEPIDPVAGHVPGAQNHPFVGNLQADGRFKSAEELRRRFDAILAGTPAANLISMCGSGVTACHNLLAMEVAGLVGGKLYVGSWSEWIRDPARPIATGH